MEWYLPITILPAIGLIIMSTVTQTIAISAEINDLLSNKCSPFQHMVSDIKIKQLGLLTRSTALLYLSAGCFVLSGVIGRVSESVHFMELPSIILYVGTIFVFIALGFLNLYGFRAVKVRRIQHEHNHNL
ncbi:hypothetical protein [Aureispira anguillae]|uniref:DUF2721 domain-containing protein n=1 Tax=Aureispira anguillae TaxID=2864201 RepID=A0A915YLW3_9BACT|nr:hypothetical protein [Aureispira anguillae]BDS15518.1 hypothetical protein AsAng_0063020 [Aureispira anguillae]